MECKVSLYNTNSGDKFRINRNIVECKGILGRDAVVIGKGINRNIVECKDIPATEKSTEQLCINRNIVECKGTKILRIIGSLSVLIETSWNVKDIIYQDIFVHCFVLIETSWNVKFNVQ